MKIILTTLCKSYFPDLWEPAMQDDGFYLVFISSIAFIKQFTIIQHSWTNSCNKCGTTYYARCGFTEICIQ